MSGLTNRVHNLASVRTLLLFAIVFVSGPATLWAQGEKTRDEPKSSPAALTAYSDAASFQNNNAYELAAEEWARFLKRFGKDPLAAKAQHYQGVCYVQLKRYEEAVRALQPVITQHPKFEFLEDTYLNLAWSQYCLGQAGDANWYKRAVEAFTKLEAAYPKGKYVDQALFFRAESLYALGKKKDAAMAYGKLATNHAESQLRADALYALGVTLEEMSQWKQATKAYEMFLADYAEDELATEVRMRLAESILQGGDAKAAEVMFAEVAAISSFAAADHALLRQAYCAVQQGKDREAAKLYESLIERFPKSTNVPEATLSAARCYYRVSQMEAAASWLDKAVALGGAELVEAAHWRCRIYLRGNQPAKALELAEQVLGNAGDDLFVPNLRLDKADALYATEGRQADALAEYRAIAEAYPSHNVAPVTLYNAAFAALELKDYDGATKLAEQFLAAHATHSLRPDVQYIVAECKLQTKDYAEAESIYRQLIAGTEKHEELPLWQVRYGLALYLQKKYQEVIDWFAPLAGKFENAALRAELLYLSGASQFQLKKYETAASLLGKSLEADAGWRQADETLLFLARSQRQLGQLPEAIGSLEKLLKTYPESVVLGQAYYQLGEFQYAEQQYAAAIAAYDQVLQDDGESTYVPYSLYGKGWSLLKSGQFESAVAAFGKLVDQYGEHALQDDALFARGMCHRQLKKYDQAIADIGKYLESDPEPTSRAEALYERGLAESQAQRTATAVKTFSELAEKYPDYESADKVQYELAWALKSLSDEAAATEAFAKLAASHPDSSFAPEANFHVGENAYAKKDYAGAVKAYTRAAKATGNVLHEKVVYKLGWSHYQLKQYREALGQFEELLASHGDGELASDGWFMKGECLFKTEDFEKALPAFREALKRNASSPQIAVLRNLHAAQAAGQLEQWKESVELLDKLIADHEESPFLAEAFFERAQGKLKLNQSGEASKDFQQAADRSRGVVGVRALFMIGEIEFQQRKYDDAIKDFQRAMFRSVPEGAPAEMSNWQAKSGFEAGRCAEVQIQNAKSGATRAQRIAEAKKFYQYVVQKHPDHELAAQATKRLAALAQLLP